MSIQTKPTPIDYAALEEAVETKSEPVKTKNIGKSYQPKVKNVIRYISKSGMNVGGAEPVDVVNEYLTALLEDGYKVFNTHFLNEVPEGFGVLYVLVLE